MSIRPILLAFFVSLSVAQAQPGQFAAQFGPTWQRACAYTLEVAEAMPADLYTYQPVDSVFSFQAQLLHLERNLLSLCSRFVLAIAPVRPAAVSDSLSKPEVIARLRSAMDYVDQALAQTPDSQLNQLAAGFWSPDPTPRSGIFWLMRDHMTHHRGQLILYLRLNGIVPPAYRGW
jgi:uncharacterized damage-inducible protein DinB